MPEGGKSKSAGGGQQVNKDPMAERRRAATLQRAAEKADTESGMTPAQRKGINDFEEKYKNASIEHAAIIGADGRVIAESGRGTANSTSVSYNPFHDYSNDYLTHNHPLQYGRESVAGRIGQSFSGTDIKTAKEYGLKGIRAKTENYVYSIERTGSSWPSTSRVKSLYENARKEYMLRTVLSKQGWKEIDGIKSKRARTSEINRTYKSIGDRLRFEYYRKYGREQYDERRARLMTQADHQAMKVVAKELGLKYTRRRT